jgi:high-affinity nickel permease
MRAMLAFLAWGLLVGLQHALEPDHLAAVGSLASRHRSSRSLSSAGLFWGLGHAVPLLLVSAAAILAHATLPERFGVVAEMAVGVMLVILGARVLHRLWQERVHVHLHRHADGTVHAHAHSHRHGEEHEAHRHTDGVRWRSALVGMTHGLAGSAALIVMAGTAAPSAAWAMAFVLLFALGAAAGMAALVVIVSVPARWGALPAWGTRALHAAVGGLTLTLGLRLIGITGGALLLGR